MMLKLVDFTKQYNLTFFIVTSIRSSEEKKNQQYVRYFIALKRSIPRSFHWTRHLRIRNNNISLFKNPNNSDKLTD